ncbi:hypothetical protein OKA06_20130 [Novosphingobium sp. MW5]|nr:hypothetical protein [Novosphingobium sp. MW5]
MIAPAARSPIFEEAHQAGGLAAAGEPFAFRADMGEVGAGARAVFEQTRLADPQVHDAAFVHKVVADGLDEAGVGLRMLVGTRGFGQFAGLEVDVEVALARAVDAVGPVEAGVEPLRGVGRHLLGRQHVAQFVIECAGVGFLIEIAAFPAPVGPGAGQTVEDLASVDFRPVALVLGQVLKGSLVGLVAPQPGGTVFSSTGFSFAGTPALRKYFCARISEATWENWAGT